MVPTVPIILHLKECEIELHHYRKELECMLFDGMIFTSKEPMHLDIKDSLHGTTENAFRWV
jgi:hypothetical protein